MNIRYGILIVVIMMSMIVPSHAEELTWDSIQTVSQVSDFTIPSNGSYVGGLQITGIDTHNISNITIIASSYIFIANITSAYPLFGTIKHTTINTTFYELVQNRTDSVQFSYLSGGFNDSITIPNWNAITGLPGLKIVPVSAIWVSSGLIGYSNDLINPVTKPNRFNESIMLTISPSRNVRIIVVGGKVDISYLLGTESQLSGVLYNPMDEQQTQSWALWLVEQIPFIGGFLKTTFIFLDTFFTIIFETLYFLVAYFYIILLMDMCIAMVHGIIVMSRGNSTPYDGVTATVTDIYSFFKMIFLGIISFFDLIWRIVQSIATIKP